MSEQYMFIDEQNRPINPSSLGIAPPMGNQRSDKADLLDKIKPTAIVEEYRQRLLGNEYINGKWVVNENLKGRALTPLGAWDLANLMLGVSSQNVALSRLDDKTIRERAFNIAQTAQYMCLKNWVEYGIKGKDQLYFIHQIVFSNTLITLKQPEGEGIRNLLKGIVTEQRVTTEDNSKKSRFAGLGFLRR